MVANLKVTAVENIGKALLIGLRRLRVDEVSVVRTLSTTITQFVALSSKVQNMTNYSGRS